MEFIKGYQADDYLRKSFNELALTTFGIEFEDWYQEGYWNEAYIPYSLVHVGKIVANVSVNILELVIDGHRVPAIQIGTVMTDKEYRNRGLSRLLMERVLEDYSDIEIMYLFANDTVLDFYPKFGFNRIQETIFSLSVQPKNNLLPKSVTNLKNVYELAAKRLTTKRFGTVGTKDLLMFYALNVFTDDIYHLEHEQALAICQYEGDTLHLYDVISDQPVDLLPIINRLTTTDTTRVVFHFTPDLDPSDMLAEMYQGGNTLFVRNTSNRGLPVHFKHPITSQA